MATFDRLYNPSSPQSYDSETKIVGGLVGEITSTYDPKGIGRVRVKVSAIDPVAEMPAGSEGWALVGERYTNNATPGGTHRMLQAGTQVILLPHMGSPTNFFLLDCLPSTQEPPHADLDRNIGLHGEVTPRGVAKLEDDKNQSKIESRPSGYVAHVSGEGDSLEQTPGGAVKQLKANGDARMESPNASMQTLGSGEASMSNDRGASAFLREDGAATFSSAFKSGLQFLEKEAEVFGPLNKISGLIAQAQEFISGHAGKASGALKQLKAIIEQLDLPGVNPAQSVERILELTEQIDLGLSGALPKGLRALSKLEEIDNDALANAIAPQIEQAFQVDIGKVAREVDSLLEGGVDNAISNLGRAIAPTIAREVGIDLGTVFEAVDGAIDADGLSPRKLIATLNQALVPQKSIEDGIPLEQLQAIVSGSPDYYNILEEIDELMPSDFLDNTDRAFPSPELRQILSDGLSGLDYDRALQSQEILSAILPKKFNSFKNLIPSGIYRKFDEILNTIAAPLLDELDVPRRVEQLRSLLEGDEVSDETLEEIVREAPNNQRDAAKSMMGKLMKSSVSTAAGHARELERYNELFHPVAEAANGLFHDDVAGLNGAIETLAKVSARAVEDLLYRPVDEDEVTPEDVLPEVDRQTVRTRIQDLFEGLEPPSFEGLDQPSYSLISRIAFILGEPWKGGIATLEQFDDRLNGIYDILPIEYQGIPDGRWQQLIALAPEHNDFPRTMRMVLDLFEQGNFGELEESVSSLFPLPEEGAFEDRSVLVADLPDEEPKEEEAEEGEEESEKEESESEEEPEPAPTRRISFLQGREERGRFPDTDGWNYVFSETDREAVTELLAQGEDGKELGDADRELTIEGLLSTLPERDFESLDFETFKAIDRVGWLISEPWVGDPTPVQVEVRLQRLRAILPPQYADLSEEDVLLPMLGVGSGISNADASRLALKAIRDGDLGDFPKLAPQLPKTEPEPEPEPEPTAAGESEPPDPVFDAAKKSADKLKELVPPKDSDERVMRSPNLREILRELLSPLIDKIAPIVDKVLGSIRRLIEIIPDDARGAIVRLSDKVGEISASAMAGGIADGCFLQVTPHLGQLVGPKDGGRVLTTHAISELIGPKGGSSLFATLGGIGMKGGGSLFGLGSIGSLISGGGWQMAVAQAGLKAVGMIMNKDGGAELASFRGTGVEKQSEPEPYEEYDEDRHRREVEEAISRDEPVNFGIKTAGVNVDDGKIEISADLEILLRCSRNRGEIKITPSQIEIGGRDLFYWIDELDRRIALVESSGSSNP